jgi:hypothetical protein
MEMTGQSQPCQTHGNDRIPSRSFSHSFSSIDQPMRLHVAIARVSPAFGAWAGQARSHAVASSRDLLACEPYSPPTPHKHIRSAPTFLPPLYISLLPDDDTCYLHTYYRTTSQTSTSIRPHSKRGIHRRPLFAIAQANRHRHSRKPFTNNRTDSYPPLHNSTKL